MTPGTITRHPLSIGFSRQEYWSGLPFPSPGEIPDPGIKPVSPVSPASAGRFTTTEAPGKLQFTVPFIKYMAIFSDGSLADIDLPGMIRRLYDMCVDTHTNIDTHNKP